MIRVKQVKLSIPRLVPGTLRFFEVFQAFLLFDILQPIRIFRRNHGPLIVMLSRIVGDFLVFKLLIFLRLEAEYVHLAVGCCQQ